VLKEADAAITSEVTTLRQENVLLKEGNVVLREAVAVLENDVAVLKSTKLLIISLRQSAQCAIDDHCTGGEHSSSSLLTSRSSPGNQAIKLNGTAIASSYFAGSTTVRTYAGITEVIDIAANSQFTM